MASRLLQYAIAGTPIEEPLNISRDPIHQLQATRRNGHPFGTRNMTISAETEYVPRLNDSSWVQTETRRQPNTERHLYRRNPGTNDIATTHPSFRSKAVCALNCQYCTSAICERGMKAILLADTKVTSIDQIELYSTDLVNTGRVQLIGDDYTTKNCRCKIKDIACLGWYYHVYVAEMLLVIMSHSHVKFV